MSKYLKKIGQIVFSRACLIRTVNALSTIRKKEKNRGDRKITVKSFDLNLSNNKQQVYCVVYAFRLYFSIQTCYSSLKSFCVTVM